MSKMFVRFIVSDKRNRMSRKSSYGRSYTLICIWAFLAGFLFTLPGCEDEPVQRDYPRVKTLEVTNITSEGALFAAEIFEPGTGEVSEHGFVWALSNPGLEYDNRIYLGPFSGTGIYSSDVRSTLTEGLTYKVAAFVRSGEYTVYGNIIEFKSLGSMGPVITGFSPDRALCGDTIEIRGRNFSWIKASNVVRFNNATAIVCDPVNDTLLKVIVPFTLSASENIISVEISGNKTTYTHKPLLVDLPEIISFTPSAAYWRDTVIVEIKNLYSGFPMTVKVGDEKANITSPFDGKNLQFVIPETVMLTEGPLSITCQSFIMIAGVNLQLLPPVIDQFIPSHGSWSDVITLYGHFNPKIQGTSITMGGKQALIISVSRDSVKFRMPPTYYDPAGTITYNFSSFSCVSPVSFLLDQPEVTSFTPVSGYQGQTMTISGKDFNASSSEVRFNSINAILSPYRTVRSFVRSLTD